MSNKKYMTAADSRLPHPKFIPGIDSKATGILFLAGTTLGLATITLEPPRQYQPGSTAYEANTEQLFIIDQAPRFISDNNASVIPFSEHASLVSSALGLGKSDIARILGVSRPTLYSWIKGTSEPKENNHPERLRTLGELTREICPETKRPLYHRFVEEPLPEQADSILKLLLAEQWDLTRLRPLLADARRLTSARDQRLGLVPPTTISQSQQDSNFLDNSIASNLE